MNIIDKDMLESAKSGKRRSGRSELIKYLSGNRLTRSKAISAKCFDCQGMGEDNVCETITCPLFPYSPYHQNPPDSSQHSSGEEKGVFKEGMLNTEAI